MCTGRPAHARQRFQPGGGGNGSQTGNSMHWERSRWIIRRNDPNKMSPTHGPRPTRSARECARMPCRSAPRSPVVIRPHRDLGQPHKLSREGPSGCTRSRRSTPSCRRESRWRRNVVMAVPDGNRAGASPRPSQYPRPPSPNPPRRARGRAWRAVVRPPRRDRDLAAWPRRAPCRPGTADPRLGRPSPGARRRRGRR